MPTDEPAADLISAALSAPSLPCEPSESSLAIEDVRLRDASDGVGHSASHLERRGPEHVGEEARVLGEVGVEHADGLGLHGRELLLERLMVAREPLERLHLVGGEPGLVVVALPERLGYEGGVYPVVLHPAEALELAHGAHLHGIDDAYPVARGDEVGEAGHPVVAGGLHSDEDVVLGLGDGLEPRYAPLEAGLGVLEGHGPDDLGPVSSTAPITWFVLAMSTPA